MQMDIHFFLSYLTLFFLDRNVSDKVVEEIKTHILCSVTYFFNRTAYDIL